MADRTRRRGKRLGPPALAPRPVETRRTKDRFLIVCEGSTEQLYFDLLRPAGYVLNASCNTSSVVEYAIAKRDTLQNTGDEFDHVWCVFDHDEVIEQRIRAAFTRAEAEGIQIAFSNRSFELWLLLHEELLVSALSNEQLCAKLKDKYGSYHKTDRALLTHLHVNTQTAIKNAKRLYHDYDTWSPLTSNPSTTVFRLVEQILGSASAS